MSVCPNITAGMALAAECPDCTHRIGDHAYPSGRCNRCADLEHFDVSTDMAALKMRLDVIELRLDTIERYLLQKGD